jgi:hypothetical protein
VKRKKLSVVDRSIRSSERIFTLETFVENGMVTEISDKLRGYIQAMVAVGWRVGYGAAKRESGGKAVRS